MSNRAENAWFSLKLWALRSKTWASWLLGVGGLGVLLVGAYITIQPAWTVAPFATLVGSLPGTGGLGFYDGIIVMLAGIAVVVLAGRL